VMVPKKYREFYATLKDLVDKGEVPMSRIDDAVTRILRAKAALGLLDAGRSPLADRTLHASFGSAEHRALARRAVRQSLVLLKNERRALPLSRKAKRIHVAGKNADDLGNQLGGWTITWQGRTGASTQGTTILAGLKAAAGAGTQVTFSRDGAGAAGAGVAGRGAGAGAAVAAVVAGRFAQPLTITPASRREIIVTCVTCVARMVMMPPSASDSRAVLSVPSVSRQARRP